MGWGDGWSVWDEGMKELCGVGDGGIVGSGEMEGLCGVGGCGNCVGWVG